MAYHGTVDGFDFDTPLALKIYRHRGIAWITGGVQVVHGALHDIGCHASHSLCHSCSFLHDSVIEPPCRLVPQQLCWGQVGESREATKGGNEHQFFRQTALDVW